MALDQKNLQVKNNWILLCHYKKNLVDGFMKLLEPKKFHVFSNSIVGELFTE